MACYRRRGRANRVSIRVPFSQPAFLAGVGVAPEVPDV